MMNTMCNSPPNTDDLRTGRDVLDYNDESTKSTGQSNNVCVAVFTKQLGWNMMLDFDSQRSDQLDVMSL